VRACIIRSPVSKLDGGGVVPTRAPQQIRLVASGFKKSRAADRGAGFAQAHRGIPLTVDGELDLQLDREVTAGTGQ